MLNYPDRGTLTRQFEQCSAVHAQYREFIDNLFRLSFSSNPYLTNGTLTIVLVPHFHGFSVGLLHGYEIHFCTFVKDAGTCWNVCLDHFTVFMAHLNDEWREIAPTIALDDARIQTLNWFNSHVELTE